jgi:hypothetical protein
MMRLIDADALEISMIETIARMMVTKRWMRRDKENEDEIINVIHSAPTIEAEPVWHGHWRKILVPKKWNGPVVRCSECNFGGYTGSKYCPDCGAKMDLEG